MKTVDKILVESNVINKFDILGFVKGIDLYKKIFFVLCIIGLVFTFKTSYNIFPIIALNIAVLFILKDVAVLQIKDLIRHFKNNNNYYVVVDTNILYDSRFIDVAINPLFKGRFIIPLFVLQELKTMSELSNAVMSNRAKMALELMQDILDNNVEIIVTNAKRNEKKEVDIQLIDYAQSINAIVFTNDSKVQEKALARNVATASLVDLTESFEEPYGIGEVFEIEIIKKGNKSGEGIGYLRDGTMVVVADSIDSIGESIVIEIASVTKTPNGRVFFAKPY